MTPAVPRLWSSGLMSKWAVLACRSAPVASRKMPTAIIAMIPNMKA